MINLELLKDEPIDDLKKLIKYIEAIVIWRERPDMYLEPMPVDNYEYCFTKEGSDAASK